MNRLKLKIQAARTRELNCRFARWQAGNLDHLAQDEIEALLAKVAS
jgi:hypothetical protein